MRDSGKHADIRWLLQERKQLPLETKIGMTKRRIMQFYLRLDGAVYVSYSGGKDSLVLITLARETGLDIPVVFCDTGLEYEGVRAAGLAESDCVLRPTKSFVRVIREDGWPIPSKKIAKAIRTVREASPNATAVRNLYMTGMNRNGEYRPRWKIPKKYISLIEAPFKVSEKCCDHLKKKPFRQYERETGRYPIIGSMTDESWARLNSYIVRGGCNSYKGAGALSVPLSFWTEQDILDFLRCRSLSIPSEYGEIIERSDGSLVTTGAERTGCMFCGFGVCNERRLNRFERMANEQPQKWEYIINRLGMGEVLDFLGVPYGEASQ